MIKFYPTRQVGRHEEELIKMIDILSTQYAGKVCGMSIGTVITVAHDMLGRGISIERMFLILGKGTEFQSTRIDGMFNLFHQSGLTGTIQIGIFGNVRRQIKAITATTKLFHVMIFQIQLGIGTQSIISVYTYCLVLQLGQFGKAVPIGIPCRTVAVLPIDVGSHFVIRRYKGKIERGIIVKRTGAIKIGDGVGKRTGVMERFFRNDIHRSGNGGRAE